MQRNKIYICIPFFIRVIKLSCHLLTCIHSYACSPLHTFGVIVAAVFVLWLCCLSLPDSRRKMSFMKQTAKFPVPLMPFSLCVPTLQMILFKEFEQPTHWKLKCVFPPRVRKPGPDVLRTRLSRHDTLISMMFHTAVSCMSALAAET